MPTAKKSRTKAAAPGKVPIGDQYLSRAVGKALSALELLQLQSAPMALNEIAARIQLSKTSTFRLLRTLQSAGYLMSNSQGQYSMAPEIRSVVPTQFLVRLLRASTVEMRTLSRELRESVSLAALFENHSEVVSIVESPDVVRMSNVLGHILPPNASALGKVITAFLPEPRREKLLRTYGLYRFTPFTITGETELAVEFDRIRKRKFAVDREESVLNGCCFAVPIFNEGGDVAAAISTSIPKVRLRDEDHERQIVETLQASSAEIFRQILAGTPKFAARQ